MKIEPILGTLTFLAAIIAALSAVLGVCSLHLGLGNLRSLLVPCLRLRRILVSERQLVRVCSACPKWARVAAPFAAAFAFKACFYL